ncbi:hypothetical protein HNP98_002062 [Hymenobacter sp. 9A]|uniref:GH16 domain-containing protein n=1 Tax=Hymenobacter caeli TaxID=2735894 RepID=A0ABX2FQ00_9BACT|nr:hypothetical protein [Hymenobacter caeli]
MALVLGLRLLPAQAQDSLRYANWRLEQADEFNTAGDSAAVAARWRLAYPWGRNLGGYETEYYEGQEVNVRGGFLLLTAHRLAAPRPYGRGQQLRYASGMLYGRHPLPDALRPAPCPPGEGLSYGLFEMRCRLPAAAGAFPAFWLFGTPDEVDIFEGDPGGVSNNVHLHAHDYWRPGPVEEPECQCFYYWPRATRFAGQYHRYALEWLPGQLTFYFDGVPVRRETRFRPLGCGMAVIANLAVWAWMRAPADTLAIDYIRIYRPRQLPAAPFGFAAGPTAGLFAFPRAVAPERSNPPGVQAWALWRAPGGQVHLALRDNFNPACASTLPLPTGAAWQGPWLAGPGATPIAVSIADTAALHWAVLTLQGRALRTGPATPGPWRPPLAGLAPGAYWVRLGLGAAVRYQAAYVLDQPADSRPAAAWLEPPAGAAP